MPIEIGSHPESGDVIKADIGRYGPYLRCGKNTSSVISPDNILDLNIERAVEILSSKSKNTSTTVIKELGIDKTTKASIEIKNGRYGVYVTNGKINATLPKSTVIDDITLDIAIDLIKNKKTKGYSRKKFRKK